MKTFLAVGVLIFPTLNGFGQKPPDSASDAVPNSARPVRAAEEAEAAFAAFDFNRLAINPNNLTARAIADLKVNFLEAVRPRLLADGAEPAVRLRRVAAPVFRLHGAVKSQTMVFDHPVPTVFTWKETFVTFSTAALDLLTDEEVAALVAHEIGHLYYAERLAEARAAGDDRAARRIELQCDLVALVTLTELRTGASNLISAVEKFIEKRDRLHIESRQPGSPPFASREKISELYAAGERKPAKRAKKSERKAKEK